MKKLTLAAAALAVASPVLFAGPLVPNKTVNIRFDGFCDGLRLVINQNTGVVTGNRTGCASDVIVGGAVTSSIAGAGVTVATSNFGSGIVFWQIDDNPRNFKLTLDTGFSNSGTYTVGVPAMAPVGSGSSSTGQ
jgi:hypothetical protein